MLGTKRKDDFEPYWQDQKDWLCEEKNEFLNLVRSNEDMGNDYITELTPPTTEEIRNARPLATVLPEDALTHAMLIGAAVCAGTEDDRAVS